MTRLEIATRILCSKNCTEKEAWIMSGNLIGLDKTIYKEINGITYIDRTEYPLIPDEAFDISQRTADRTQQLIDLGFEWNEEHGFFTKGVQSISPYLIEEYKDDEWNRCINSYNEEPTFSNDIENVEVLQDLIKEPTTIKVIPIVDTDFFKGKPYIEFEMKNTNLRLYNMDKQLEAEKDLDSNRIVMASENKEFELGITIFKK